MNVRTTGSGFANQSSNKSGASKAYDGAAKFAAEAAEEIKQSASETVSGLGDHLRQIMDSQVESGAAAVSTLAIRSTPWRAILTNRVRKLVSSLIWLPIASLRQQGNCKRRPLNSCFAGCPTLQKNARPWYSVLRR